MRINYSQINVTNAESKAALAVLAADAEFTGHIESAMEKRETAIETNAQSEAQAAVDAEKAKVSQFRENNIALTQKLEAFAGFDADEYKRMKEVGSNEETAAKAMAKLEADHKAVIELKDTAQSELQKSIETMKQEALQKDTDIEKRTFQNNIKLAISEYNHENPSKRVSDKAVDLFAQQVEQNSSIGDNGRVMLNQDKPFITTSGNGTVKEWISEVGYESFPFMFSQPSGGGASGGTNSSGAGAKTMSRNEFDAISDPARKSEVATTFKITD